MSLTKEFMGQEAVDALNNAYDSAVLIAGSQQFYARHAEIREAFKESELNMFRWSCAHKKDLMIATEAYARQIQNLTGLPIESKYSQYDKKAFSSARAGDYILKFQTSRDTNPAMFFISDSVVETALGLSQDKADVRQPIYDEIENLLNAQGRSAEEVLEHLKSLRTLNHEQDLSQD